MDVRSADKAELDRLAEIWHEVWHESHAPLMPAELTRLRTLESFRDRLRALLADIRVVGTIGTPLGFCITRADELYQLYLSAEARGTGVAPALLADAEARLLAAGVNVTWLACAVGNHRAARFYEKSGWRQTATENIEVDTSAGPFPLEIWRFEKTLDHHTNTD
jgi:GNAT superfamily N-acetyltransferase